MTAYNGYYPNYYQPYQLAQPMPQQPAQLQQPLPQLPQQSGLQIQNGGFVSVRSIDEARNYPVAPGNSVTFKDEQSPYVYTKTQGFSQLDRPIFEKFRLVKEDDVQQVVHEEIQTPEYALKTDVTTLSQEIDQIKEMIENIVPLKEDKA